MPEPQTHAAAPTARGGDTDEFDPTPGELLALVRATSDLVLVLDTDGRYLRVGSAGRDALYRPARELLGRRFDEIFPPDEAARFLAVVRAAIDSGETQTLDYPLEIHGRVRWYHATVAPTGEGTVVWIARDCTERRAAEHTRRATAETLRLLAEHSTDLVALHAPDGRYEYVSPSVARLLERDPEDLIGTDPVVLAHPEDAPQLRRESYEVALRGLQPPPATYRMRTASGDYVWFETLTKPIRDESGVVVRLLTSSRDVSERRESEQALQAAAMRDDLTGVFNRRGFLAAAEQTLARAQRHDDGVILVFVDLDDLKPINDRYGHEEGDHALRAATAVLRGTVRDGDVLGRIGGDEFAMLLAPMSHAPNTPHPLADADGAEVERRIRARLDERLARQNRRGRGGGGHAWTLAMSAGIVLLPLVPPDVPAAEALRELMRRADRRLYDEKRSRKPLTL